MDLRWAIGTTLPTLLSRDCQTWRKKSVTAEATFFGGVLTPMLAPSERPLPPDVAAALDHARVACDALGVLDALHSKMHKFVQMVTLQLQQTDGGAPVELPNRKDYLKKLDKQSSKRPLRR